MDAAHSFGACGTDYCVHELDPDKVFIPVRIGAREGFLDHEHHGCIKYTQTLFLELGVIPSTFGEEIIPEELPVTILMFTRESFAEHICHLLKLGINVFGAGELARALNRKGVTAALSAGKNFPGRPL